MTRIVSIILVRLILKKLSMRGSPLAFTFFISNTVIMIPAIKNSQNASARIVAIVASVFLGNSGIKNMVSEDRKNATVLNIKYRDFRFRSSFVFYYKTKLLFYNFYKVFFLRSLIY